jgi:hypothetical protein
MIDYRIAKRPGKEQGKLTEKRLGKDRGKTRERPRKDRKEMEETGKGL